MKTKIYRQKKSTLYRSFVITAVVLVNMGIIAIAADLDNDGMQDDYEAFYALDETVDDAALNYDDSLQNIDESLINSDPFTADTDRDGFLDDADI